MLRKHMTFLIFNSFVFFEFDDEIDDVDFSFEHVWIYLCKFLSCFDYDKFWNLRSNFLFYLQNERKAHEILTTTFVARRAIEIKWRYIIDSDLPSLIASDFRFREDSDEQVWYYSFKDDTGKMTTGRGTLKQMEMHKALRCRQAEGAQVA